MHTYAHSRNDSYLKRLRYSVLSAAMLMHSISAAAAACFSSKVCGCTRAEGSTDDQKTGAIRQSGERGR
jgi:hypothetical protein